MLVQWGVNWHLREFFQSNCGKPKKAASSKQTNRVGATASDIHMALGWPDLPQFPTHDRMPDMILNPHVSVQIDLPQIWRNAESIAKSVPVPMIAVVKADAYGLGARQVAGAINDVVDAFYVFDAAEAVEYDLFHLTGKRTIALTGRSDDAADYIRHRIHPAVWTLERAALLKDARPVLSVDCGQQRFGCPLHEVADFTHRTGINEIFTHAITAEQALRFDELTRKIPGSFRHAAGSALLKDSRTWFDAVRPGMALYQGAMRVSTALIEARESHGPAGYTGFTTSHHGVIRCGYSNGLRPGACIVNGSARRIVEVGMQSAFVELGAKDRVGDEVILLGDGLTESDVATQWKCTPQEALMRLSGAGVRSYNRTGL